MAEAMAYGNKWLAPASSSYAEIDGYQFLRGPSSMQPYGGYGLIQGASPSSLASAPYCDLKQHVAWTDQEDQLLRDLIARYGTTKWSLIASKIPFKTNKHCRRRWQACLNAHGNKGAWTAEEDAKLVEGHRLFGNRWTEIAKLVPGRTDNAAKNRFSAITKGTSTETPSSSRQEDMPLSGSESTLSDGGASMVTSLAAGNMKKRGRDAQAMTSVGMPGGCRKLLWLDLNINTGGCASDSDHSAVLDVDEGAESVRTRKAARCWLDLNIPCTPSDSSNH